MASFLTKIFGSRNDRLIKQYRRKVAVINKLEPEIKALSDEQLKAKTAEFRQRLADGASLDSLLPEAFAVVREASFRVLGMRHFDVQLIGGMVLNDGKIAEMRTGEGKTLTATLAVYLNALPGKGAHVVTVNDYLASRDAAWMGKVYNFLGMTVGTILSNQPNDQKQAAYAADITYGTNNEFGFDYRMAMNIPDYWIKIIKERRDEDWKPSSLFWEVTNRRKDEKTISYCESHDQALVGDKTIIFRLIDADMYWHFKIGDENGVVERGIALHKMIRLLTASTINGGYLNFMGNEFGHPEWIDFPREGNGWSYKYARRQWNLVDNPDLCYHYLGDFDEAMVKLIRSVKNIQKSDVIEVWHNDGDQILAYRRKDLVFVFNFNPTRSFTDYGFLVPRGAYDVVLNTDNKQFGGFGFSDDSLRHFTCADPLYAKDKKEWLKLYVPARSAVVLKRVKD